LRSFLESDRVAAAMVEIEASTSCGARAATTDAGAESPAKNIKIATATTNFKPSPRCQ
jgi:hypothetical protein